MAWRNLKRNTVKKEKNLYKGDVNMVEGYCYSVPNEYILKKLIKFVQKKSINFSVFDFYIVTEFPVDFKDFKFKISKYYLQRIGQKLNGEYEKVKLDCWKNNTYKPDMEYVNEISKYGFKLIKKDGIYVLYMKDKKYNLKYSLHMCRYFYQRKDVFFEKDYNLSYVDDGIMDSNMSIDNNVEETEDIFENDIYIPDRPGTQYENVFQVYDRQFDFNVFHRYYFRKLTLNQKKICALLLLGIKVTDIARLLETTQVYITLEIRRLSKKIRKIYNKTQKEFWV